ELLTEPLREPLSYQTRDDVTCTAGAIADDDAHRPRRIGLRPCHARHRRERGRARSQMQKLPAAGEVYFLPPPTSFDQPLREPIAPNRYLDSQPPCRFSIYVKPQICLI